MVTPVWAVVSTMLALLPSTTKRKSLTLVNVLLTCDAPAPIFTWLLSRDTLLPPVNSSIVFDPADPITWVA